MTSMDSEPTPTPIYTDRPPSPVPSYHTLPPNTHSSLSSGPRGLAAPLVSAARATPNALLSTLTITNHSNYDTANHSNCPTHAQLPPPNQSPGGINRHLTARTADGRERYCVVNTPGEFGTTVWRNAGPRTRQGTRTSADCHDGQMEVAGRWVGGSQGLKVMTGDGIGAKEKLLISVDYEVLQKTARLDLQNFTVEGKDVGMRCEVVTLADSLREATNSVPGSGHPPRRKSSGTSRTSTDTHDKKRNAAGLSSIKLVDADGNIYAEYSHTIGLPDLHRDGEVWGKIGLRARAVLIDGDGGAGDLAEKMDRAFLTLAVLLEAYVRVFGGSKKGERNWGNFAGGMGCVLM